jgi:hypothetical protein
MDEFKLNIGKFEELSKDTNNQDIIKNINLCSQSIHRWLQYCKYHYYLFDSTQAEADLALDRISNNYKRANENVSLRYVYEANIAAFLNSFHSMIDSFPYLLNLFITVESKFESINIKWHHGFLSKYKEYPFYDCLMSFMLDDEFHKVKCYVNNIKHKHLIRIMNQWEHLEFETYIYKKPELNSQGEIRFKETSVEGENIQVFMQKCHDNLMPKFFNLCKEVIQFKESGIQKHYNK